METSTSKSQNNWCEFSSLLPPKQIVRRFDSRSHRFYWWQAPENGKLVTKTGVGITSLLSMVSPESKPLTDWKIRTEGWKDVLENSSEYGTAMHQIATQWLLKRTVPKEMLDAARIPVLRAGMNFDMPEKDLTAWILFCEEYQIKPLLIEAMLISPPVEGQHFCQAIDLLCELTVKETVVEIIQMGAYKSGPRKGQAKTKEKKTKALVKKIACLDWKSNFASRDARAFYSSHKFQLIAAKKAVEWNYQGIKVDLLINWAPDGWRTAPSYTMKTWDITQQDLNMFDSYIQIAYISGFFKPTGSIFVAPEFGPETKSSDFKLMSYIEFVENVLLRETPQEQQPEFIEDIESPILSCIDLITE